MHTRDRAHHQDTTLRAVRAFVNSRSWLVGLLLLTAGGAAHAEIIDRVLAVVNGTVITLSDVMAARELGLVSPGEAQDPVRAILSRLIDRALELDEVDRYAPPEPTSEMVDAEAQTVRARFVSQAAFDAALTRCGIDLPQLREIVRRDLRIRAYLDQRFTATQERRQQLIDDWLAGLRRRAEIIDLSLTRR